MLASFLALLSALTRRGSHEPALTSIFCPILFQTALDCTYTFTNTSPSSSHAPLQCCLLDWLLSSGLALHINSGAYSTTSSYMHMQSLHMGSTCVEGQNRGEGYLQHWAWQPLGTLDS